MPATPLSLVTDTLADQALPETDNKVARQSERLVHVKKVGGDSSTKLPVNYYFSCKLL